MLPLLTEGQALRVLCFQYSSVIQMEYSKYEVPYNPKPLRARRKLRVVCIGGGLGGMTLAYKIQHEMKLEDVIDFTIYERQVSSILQHRLLSTTIG